MQQLKVKRSFLSLLLLLLPSTVLAGTVETATGNAAGTIQFAPAAVKVGGKPIAWADVLSLVAEPSAGTLPHLYSLRLRSGEQWAGLIVKSSTKQLDFRGDWLGPRAVDLDLVSILEFTPQPPPLTGLKRQMLYRQRGEPVPGTLLWIENDSLGLDSPLGSTEIKRQGLVRYVFDNQPPPPAQDTDEVGLADGSILRGRAQPELDSLRLEHAVLGRVDLPARAVRFVLRHSAARIDLSELPPIAGEAGDGTWAKGRQSSLTVSPLAFGAAAEPASADHGLEPGPIKVMRIEPKLTLRFPLPKPQGRKLLLATVTPVEGARGDTHIRLHVDKQLVWEKEVSPTELASPLDVALPEGDELTIDVDFGARLRFPCGVLLKDAHLVVAR